MNTGNPNIDDAVMALRILTRQIMDTHQAWERENDWRVTTGLQRPDTSEPIVLCRMPIGLARAAMNAIEKFVIERKAVEAREEAEFLGQIIDPETHFRITQDFAAILATVLPRQMVEGDLYAGAGAAPRVATFTQLRWDVDRIRSAEHRRDQAIEQLRNELNDLRYLLEVAHSNAKRTSRRVDELEVKVLQR